MSKTAPVRNVRTRKPIFLAFGFTAFLLVLAASAFLVWRNATQAQARASALHEAHMHAGAALSSIRSNVYLIGILTRDFLLDSEAGQSEHYVQQLNAIRLNTVENFRELAALGQDDAAQHAAIAKLQREFEAYWDPTEIALDWTPMEKRLQRSKVLQARVRRREEVFALTSQVEQLITANYLRERERITSSDQEFRSSLGWTAAIALLLGLVIAAVTLTRMRDLERHSLAAESELRRLSGQIRMAQEQERKFLSRELHDQVGQMLTGLRMELASLARVHPSGDEFASRIASAKSTVEQTLGIVRNIAMLLRPSMLDDLGLTPALRWLIKEISRSSSIEIQADIDPTLDSLPDAHRTCLYRVVQEALTNSSRHSGASRVDVTLWTGDGWVNGVISDDGRGFQRAAQGPDGLGLLGMEERARELGGNIRIESAPGRGTRVEVRLPRPVRPGVANDQDTDSGRSRDRSDRVEASA